ncbi:hypothetical protein F-VV57_0232 [Faustovirus]|nr:hypothetical protein F-VV57_0232 [Faustovirus]QJX73500.1 hypothetical protein F-VV63_0234 [Faustovirus]
MSTVKSLFALEKAVFIATTDRQSKKSVVWVYNLIDGTVKRYKPIGDSLSWQYRSLLDHNADLSTRLANESLVYSDDVQSTEIATEINEYWCYLIINGNVKISVDAGSTYLPNGYSASGAANYVTYTALRPSDSTPHGIVLFTIERYKQIVKANETIDKIMCSDI